MSRWIVIAILCIIYTFAMGPIDKSIRRKFPNKYAAFCISFAIGICILFALYCLTDLLGLMPE